MMGHTLYTAPSQTVLPPLMFSRRTMWSRPHPAWGLLLAVMASEQPLLAQEPVDAEAVEARLESLRGVDRLRALADLVDAYRSTAPAKAVSYAETALAVAEASPDAIAEVRVLNEKAWALMELGRYDEAVESAEGGLALARKAPFRRGEARAMNNLGVIARRTGDYAKALDCFRQAQEIYAAIGDEAAVATSLNNLSVVLGFDVGDYQRALENQLEALAVRERLGDERGRYQSYNTLGVIYDNLEQHDDAVRYLNMALEGWRTLGLQPRIAATLNNLAGAYTSMGRLESALALQQEALSLREQLESTSGVAFSLASIGEILVELGRLDEARAPLQRSLDLRREMGERKNEAQSLLGLARLERARRRFAQAEALVTQAVSIARQISAPEEERDAYLELSALREARGDFRGALEAYKAWDRLDDGLFGQDRARRIEALEAEYRAARSAREIERLSAQAELSASLAQQRRTQLLVLSLVALVAFLLYRRTVMSRTRRNLERQVQERTAELSEANHRLKALSLTDTLTGLPNRRYFFQAVEGDVALCVRAYRAALREGARPESADLVFYVLDLDDFKSVNDEYGHAVGDKVLQQVASALRETSRASDTVVRWGGEEFLIMSRQVDRAGAAAFAERIRQAIRRHMFAAGDGRMLHRTCSVGFAAYPFVPDDPEAVHWDTVLGIADQAAYAAKRGGRDAWVGLTEAHDTEVGEVSAARETLARLVLEDKLGVVASLDAASRHDLWRDDEVQEDRASGQE